MRCRAYSFLVAGVCLFACASRAQTCREVSDWMATGAHEGESFSVDATVTEELGRAEKSLLVEDDSGTLLVDCQNVMDKARTLASGNRIRIAGQVTTFSGKPKQLQTRRAMCDSIELTGKGVPVRPIPAKVRDLLGGLHDYRLVSIDAKVVDVFPDEIDPKFIFLTLAAENDVVYAAIPDGLEEKQTAQSLIGAQVRATGVCYKSIYSHRKQLGSTIVLKSAGSLRVLAASKSDAFDAPDAEELAERRPADFPALVRHVASGRVIAVWRDMFLLKTVRGNIIRVQSADAKVPRYGIAVQAAGFPESDFFNVNLKRAEWRPCAGQPLPEPPEEIEAESLFSGVAGRTAFNAQYHGKSVRVSGKVLSIPYESSPDRRLYLESNGTVLTVDASSAPEVLRKVGVGFTVSVAGTYVMETDTWRPNAVFPQVRGFFIVIRTPEDLTVLGRPSWWTPGRFVALLAVLLTALSGSAVGNLVLRKLVARRSRELESEIVARVGSELKVHERTRLAVELHDAISQNLTGVALEIRTAAAYAGEIPPEARRHLDIAANTLGTCRNELRNCLWDLRNNALELPDMDEAIRQTLAPHIGAADLSVRFSVPRDMLSDNTAHDILHIVRELVSNAVRHGKATRIRVAGAIEGDRFLCSVRDNGTGFDPENCPGLEQGHFGLLGIRERVKSHEGSFTVESRPGGGTRATITLTVPKKEST